MAFFRPIPRVVVLAFVAAAAAAIGATFRAPVARASAPDVVSLANGTAIHLATPPFLVVGKRYAFTWPGGGPPQTFVLKAKRDDGWILVDVADETTRPELYVPGEFPTRWLHAALAVSIQEMRALP
jgi:hypothetical protein